MANRGDPGGPWRNPQLWIGLFVFLASAVLLFTRIGHYALWDDEANTALTAKGVLQTGDTSAVLGENVVAYRSGWTLRDLKERAQPPLPAYVAAVSTLVTRNEAAFGMRFGFALCGLATVGLILWWMWRENVALSAWVFMSCALLGNVSFFLYCRQARYYGLAILLSAAMGYLYANGRTRLHLALFGVLSLLLLATQYLIFAAVWACFVVDYAVWGRKRRPLRGTDWLLVFAPTIVIGSVVVLIWNPFDTLVASQVAANSLAQRLTLIWWNLRDLNRAEFCCGLLLLAAPVLRRIDRWAVRTVIAVLVYVCVISFVSVQPVAITTVADIRYLVPLIPLCIAMVAISLSQLRPPLWLAVTLGLVLFGTNLGNLGFLSKERFRSTLRKYVNELKSPIAEPYTPAADWIRNNVPAGNSVWVSPDYMTYPLMFHAPQVMYAWQLESREKWLQAAVNEPKMGAIFEQFKTLPPIHFKLEAAPDYIVLFGPTGQQAAMQIINAWETSNRYDLHHTIDCYWRDLYRPELFARSFESVTNYNKETDIIYILKRTD